MSRISRSERAAAIENLRSMLKPGDTVYTVLRHVSAPGMSRKINVYRIENNAPQWLSRRVALAIGESLDERSGAIKVSGCGMDMGFHIVYNLGHVLWPKGFGELGWTAPGSVRPTTRAAAELAVKGGAKFFGRNGDNSGWDSGGGFALKQEWF